MTLPRGDIFMAGVGGQGALLASEVLGEAFLSLGCDVKKSEVHGMAQRGGAVTTHLRFGPKVYSPLIEQGKADLLIAFEKIEGLRFAHYLRPGGVLLANTQEINPPSVATGRESYPADAVSRLNAVTDNLYMMDALVVALALKEVRTVNVVMIGAGSRFLPLPEDVCEAALEKVFPERVLDVNIKAFRAGRALLPSGEGV